MVFLISEHCAEDQGWTGDPSLFRRMLYQLSYLDKQLKKYTKPPSFFKLCDIFDIVPAHSVGQALIAQWIEQIRPKDEM